MPINPPYVCQGRTDHPAQLFRMSLAGVAGGSTSPGTTTGSGGVNSYFGQLLAVSGLSSMNVSVGTGLCYIPSSTSWAGMYSCYNTASFNVSIAASSSTQWRRDYVVAQVTDPGDNTANWNVVSVTGTFSSTSPGSLPALPNNCIPLAIVNVVPNMTVTNGTGTISDARPWQPLAGVATLTSSTAPSTTRPDGTLWVETDTDVLGVLLNSTRNYVLASPSKPDTWHSITPSNGWGSSPIEYRLFPALNAVWVLGNVDASGASNATFATLPSGYRPATSQDAPVGFHTAAGSSSGTFLRTATSGTMSLINYTTSLGVIVINNLISLDA